MTASYCFGPCFNFIFNEPAPCILPFGPCMFIRCSLNISDSVFVFVDGLSGFQMMYCKFWCTLFRNNGRSCSTLLLMLYLQLLNEVSFVSVVAAGQDKLTILSFRCSPWSSLGKFIHIVWLLNFFLLKEMNTSLFYIFQL